MRRVIVVAEGQTEVSFLQPLLASHLGERGIPLTVAILGRPGHKGGAVSLDRVVDDIYRHIAGSSKTTVTTFFDYYRLNWKSDALVRLKPAATVAAHFERELTDRVCSKFDTSFDRSRFIAYIQLHELEALFFAQPSVVASALGKPEAASDIEQIVESCGGCEAIDDRPETHPAARLTAILPAYKKGGSDKAHAPILAKRMQLEVLRSRCPRFNEWVNRLESLAIR